MHIDAPKNNIVNDKLNLLCVLKLIFGFRCNQMPLLDYVHALIKLAQSQDIFIYAGGAQQNVAALDAGSAQQNVVASDAGNAQQNVAASDARSAQQNVATSNVATAQHNVATSNEATDDQSVVASDQEIGEQNCALSQLKHKDSIGIDCFRICGHQKIAHQNNYRLIKLYKFFEV